MEEARMSMKMETMSRNLLCFQEPTKVTKRLIRCSIDIATSTPPIALKDVP